MAESGKGKSPGSGSKKTQEGSGKKRRKHKKSTDASGDGAPSNSASSTKNQTPMSSSQTRQDGATASTSKCEETKDSKPLSEKVDDKEVLAEKSSPSATAGSVTPGGNRAKKDNKPSDKSPQQHETKVSKSPQQHLLNQEGSGTKISEQSRQGTTQGAGKERQDSESSGKQTQTVKDKKDIETPGKIQHKNDAHDKQKPEQRHKDHTEAEKVSGSTDVQQNSKVKAKGEVKKTESHGDQQKSQVKIEPGKKPDAVDGEQKSKAQLRAERRAIQEAQRAAKDAKKIDTVNGSSAVPANTFTAATVKKEPAGEKTKPAGEKAKPAGEKTKPAGEKMKSLVEVNGTEKGVTKKKSAANAVMQNETEEQMWARKEKEMLGKSLKIDNSILNLGFQYFHHNIVGANARCVALLATLKEVIKKYRTPEEKELSRDLEKNLLNPCITYLNYCRPISTSMGNAIKHLKYHINKIPSDKDDDAAISELHEVIDNFIHVHFVKDAEAVAECAGSKIGNGDVILVYAASSLIAQVLKTAHQAGKVFRVIVVEGRPRTEGKTMLRFLVRCGIPCSYIYIGSAVHAMSEATKVFLGAAAMFAIGDMHSRSGNSMIAALAKANNIPVLVCCETYKFTDKVQLHLGDSNLHSRGKDLVTIGHRTPILANWEEIGLRLLNIMYDVTGSQYITAVVTELGMLPCTSVPAVLRRQEDFY